MPKPALHLRRRLSLESLESRAMMAGNVTVSVVDGNLMVTGDDASNGVKIEQATSDEFRVTTYSLGGSATLLNGSTNNQQTFSGVRADVNVEMNGSYDEVTVKGLSSSQAIIPGNLKINGGNAPDNVTVVAKVGSETSGGYVIILSANVNLSNTRMTKNLVLSGGSALVDGVTVTGDVAITGTDANDSLSIDALHAGGNVNIDSRKGRDFVRLAHLPVVTGDVRIVTGDGEDRVSIGSLTAQNLTVNLGAGPNHLSIFGDCAIGHQAHLFGGNQADDMTIDGLHVQDQLYIWLYDGDDQLKITNSSAPYALFRGGDGNDTLTLGTDTSSNKFDQIDQSEFE
jgi:hypothetical protein